VIDFHCHLDLYPDPFSVAAKCRNHDLYVLSVTTTPSAWPKSRTLAADGDRIRVALGLHPQLAHERKSELGLFDELIRQTRYVGEVGLDGGPELRAFQHDQMQVFDHVLASCKEAGGRILSIHSRRATAQVIDRLCAHPDAGTPILHWFSGSLAELDRAIAHNCWFSVGASMLSSRKGQSLISRMPRDRVLTETDGPFAHAGGAPLMPWDVHEAQTRLFDLWNITQDEGHVLLRDNLRRLAAMTA
jgi:TatD DNase family protein